MPPGTWLTSAMSCAARNAPRKNGSQAAAAAAARRARPRQPPVERRQHELGRDQRRRRQRISAADRTAAAARRRRHRIARAVAAAASPRPRAAPGAKPSTRASGPRAGSTAEHEQPEPERARIEEHDARDVLAAQPPARVEAVTRRRARQQREADVVRDRVADERRHRDLPLRDRPADVQEGELVVAGEDEVVQEGEGGERDGSAGGRALSAAVSPCSERCRTSRLSTHRAAAKSSSPMSGERRCQRRPMCQRDRSEGASTGANPASLGWSRAGVSRKGRENAGRVGRVNMGRS